MFIYGLVSSSPGTIGSPSEPIGNLLSELLTGPLETVVGAPVETAVDGGADDGVGTRSVGV